MAFPSPLWCKLPSCSSAAGRVPVLRAARFHPHLRFGFGGWRFRHPLGEHNLREGESPAPRGCQGQRLLGREFRQIKSRGRAVGGSGELLGSTTCPLTLLGSPIAGASGHRSAAGRCSARKGGCSAPSCPALTSHRYPQHGQGLVFYCA